MKIRTLLLYSSGGTSRDIFLQTYLGPLLKKIQGSKLLTNGIKNEQYQRLLYSLISPYEAVLRKSCLILMEGYYNGILIADVHYIPVKSDYSNIKEVLKKIKNVKSTKRLIENSYFDLVLSNKYSYESFVDSIIKHSNVQVQNKKSSRFTQLLFKIYIQFISFKNHSFTLLYMVYYKINLINER